MSDPHDPDNPDDAPFASPEEGTYELVMPFIVTATHGGPYDDESYVCGWELGHLDAVLTTVKAFGLGPPILSIHRGNVPQAELLAMKHDMHLKEIPFAGPTEDTDAWLAEWAPITFQFHP